MTGEPVLIAGFSGRALAESAQRAGFRPYVVDGCGDTDMLAAAGDCVVLPHVLKNGFRYSELSDALAKLTSRCPSPPVGIVLGAGFEPTPKLIASLARDMQVLGCSSDAIGQVKDPAWFFPLLRQLGIPHPATDHGQEQVVPADGHWISKRVGGMGGRHIRRIGNDEPAGANRYRQQDISGEAISATALLTHEGPAFAFTKTWVSPTQNAPYRFGGIVGNVLLDDELEARLIDLMLTLLPHLGLVGLVSFDFLVDDGETFLLEVNPRPGASLDVLDDDDGTLISAHIMACTGGNALDVLAANWRPGTRASAYLYADRGALTVPDIDWPDWVHDRPGPGSRINEGAPVATIHAEDETPEIARKLCQERLGLLYNMLYDKKNS